MIDKIDNYRLQALEQYPSLADWPQILWSQPDVSEQSTPRVEGLVGMALNLFIVPVYSFLYLYGFIMGPMIQL